MHKILKIFQGNAHGVSRKKHEILNFANVADIFVNIESWLKPNMKDNFKNFAVIRNDRISNKGGGICICIKKDIMFQSCDAFTDIPDVLENLNVFLFLNTIKQRLLLAVYRPPHNNFNTNIWNKFFLK